jgi:Ca2+-binding EF-hand superfamily protein
MDLNGDGKISYSEFITSSIGMDESLSNDCIESAFRLFDKDLDGLISVNDLKQFFKAQESWWANDASLVA